jgi:cold shock CspA family protein
MEGWERFTGKITTWFNERKYGFIRSRKLGKEVFVHADDLDFEPQEGTKVIFEVEKTPKGLRARRIRES